ncbi:MAG: DUF4194 domain-containing protein [Enterocloster clostridioformis]|nr:DUF4194 domain-containing protein [Enterocloster clostridioformis]
MENMELKNSMTDITPASGCSGNGIPYYDNLMQSEQTEVTEIIRLLWRQTFLLEHKYDKRTGRFQYNRDYRVCSKHLEFIKNYFAISGVKLLENSQMGVMYIQGENVVGDKLPRLATLYLLVLKLIYDEQMESVSTSINVYTSLREIHEKLGNYRLFRKQPAATEIRRAVTLLKKYQVIEPLDLLEDLKSESRMIIYPCINVVLMGDDVRQLLAAFDEDTGENGIQLKADLEEDGADGPEAGMLEDEMTPEEGEVWNRR